MAAMRLAAAGAGEQHMSPRFRRRLTHMLYQETRAPRISRREAFAAGIGLAAGAIVGGLGVAGEHIATSMQPSPSRVIFQPKVGGRWVDTGLTMADLEEGVPHHVIAGAVEAFVSLYEGRLVGTSAYCSHQPCALRALPATRNLLCPCHPLTFSPDGFPQPSDFTPPPLLLVRVRVQGGRIEVFGT